MPKGSAGSRKNGRHGRVTRLEAAPPKQSPGQQKPARPRADPRRLSATSRDREEWAARTKAARETRADVAREVAQAVAVQIEELIIEGDVMGGRSMAADRITRVVGAEKTGDRTLERAAWMDLAVAAAACVAAIDYVPPTVAPAAEDDAEA